MKTTSALLTLKSGPEPVGQPRGAIVALRITGSQAQKIGLLPQWVTARKKILTRQRRQSQFQRGLKAALEGLFRYAEENKLTERKLAQKTGIARGSLHRCRNGQVNARTWLPKLEATLARLTAH